jgi:NmrA-like family
MYMSNFSPKSSFRPAPEAPHALTLGLPNPTDQRVMPLFHAHADTGKFVKGILKHRDSLLGKRIYAATDYYSMDDMVAVVRDVKAVDAVAVQITPAQFRAGMAASGMPEFVQVEASENFEMLAVCGYFDKALLDESHAVRTPFFLLSCFHTLTRRTHA